MTRQPAAEKRITVAWPMPRLAPVSSSVRRGAFWSDERHRTILLGRVVMAVQGYSRVLVQGSCRRFAAEFDAVVQAERAVVPEFEALRRDAPAAPARRPRHLADEMLAATCAIACSKAKRLSSGCDCLLAQAPICACFGRVAK